MSIWEALEAQPIAVFVKSSPWAYPILETAHVIGLGLLLGAIVLVDLRVLGVGSGIDRRALMRMALPIAWFGFAINAISGMLLFASSAVDLAGNASLQVKVILIAVALANVAIFHVADRAGLGLATEATAGPGTVSRASALLSLVLWVGVIVAGRMIAYIE